MKSNAAEKLDTESPGGVVINNLPVTWKPGGHGFDILGNDSIMFWVKPSLASMLQPLMDELGEDLYSQIVAFEASKGTFEDYHAMVTKMGKNFQEGFLNWGKAVSACGWGTFNVLKMDWEKKESLIRIDDPWELKLFSCKKIQNNMPFLNGKISGIFTHAFETNCRSEIIEVSKADSPEKFVALCVKPSLKTLEQTLIEVHQREKAVDPHTLNSALKRDQRRFLDVIETVGDMIWESDRNLQLTYATDRAWKVLHLGSEEVVGKNWSNLLGETHKKNLKELVESFKPDQNFVEGEFDYSVNGKRYWVYLRIKRLLDYNGNHLGYVGSAGDVTSQKELELQFKNKEKEFQKSALDGAHQAGMAEIATGILHNIGNILNNVNISVELIRKTAADFPVKAFSNANKLLFENKKRWGEFLTNDAKGSKLPGFYQELEKSVVSDFEHLKSESQDLLKKIQLIKEVISLQQNFAKGVEFKEKLSLEEIVDNALAMQMTSLVRHEIKVVKNFKPVDTILAQRGKLAHIILNLVKNAQEAMAALNKGRILTLTIEKGSAAEVVLRIADTGVGIVPENLKKVFSHGFTTKKEGHGFGLHYCANALAEMGGTISVSSAGHGQGAEFTIKFKANP